MKYSTKTFYIKNPETGEYEYLPVLRGEQGPAGPTGPAGEAGVPGADVASVAISAEQPTDEHTALWIDSDSDEGYNVPEIKDNEISAVDTWSSNRIKIATDGARAHNLLVNSNFADPINTRGKQTYTGNEYTIDKWIISGNAGYENTVWIADGYIGLSGGNTTENVWLVQPVRSDIIQTGKSATFAVEQNGVGIFVLNIGSWGTNTTVSFDNGITLLYQNNEMIILNGTKQPAGFKWAALYEGTYTAETLPPYIAPDKRLEAIRCLDTMPENLLDNSNFLNPVNSLGLTNLSEKGELINRWENDSAAVTSSISGSGLLASGDNGIRQKLKHQYVGKTLTLAFKNALEAITCFSVTVTSPDTTKWLGVNYDNDMFGGVMQWQNGDLFVYLHSTTFPIIWAALYEGAYTVETLPPYVPKGKKIEMLNCGVPLQPVNLLDNSDFRAGHIVNQRGVTANTKSGEYLHDCWKSEAANNVAGVVQITDAGVTLAPTSSNYCGITQMLERYAELEGKTVTLAVCVGGVWEAVSFTLGATPGGGKIMSNGLRIYSASGHHVLIRNMAGNSPIIIQRVALYEGAYTAETLPTYIPKGKKVEMLNCGVPLQPVNLLDNSNFRNPVNQRGKTLYDTSGYTIDRWMLNNTSGSVTVNTDSITVANISSNGQAWFGQRVPNAARYIGKTVTMVAVRTDGTMHVKSGVVSETTAIGYNNGTDLSMRIEAVTTDSLRFNLVVMNPGESITFAHAALYEGNYTADTLPAYQYKGYAVELAECQRYYYQSWTDNMGPAGIITRQSMSPTRLASVEMPVTMRVTPTITICNSDGIAGAIKDWDDSTVISGITTVYASNKNFVPASMEGKLTAGQWYSFHYSASADL